MAQSRFLEAPRVRQVDGEIKNYNKIQITWLKGTLQIDQPIDRNCSLKIMILGINLPARPHSAQLTISSGSPVFLFILESPRQKSQ